MHRRDFDPWGEPAILPDYVLKTDSDRKAYRAFWRGVVVGLMIGVALGWFML